MVVPGLGPVALPIPIAHSSEPPPAELAGIIDSEPATTWNEHWVGLDLDQAQKIAGQLIESFNVMRRFPALHWG